MDERELEELLDWLLDARVVRDERLRERLRVRAREWRVRREEPTPIAPSSATLALGIDVSASHGLDLVLLDETLRPRRIANVDVASLSRAIRDAGAAAIGIDSPPSWGRMGKSRRAERDLAKLGISAYAVPEERYATRFHAWMRTGFRTFDVAAEAGFARFAGGSPLHAAFEVYPYATSVALAGYRPRFKSAGASVEWRRAVLATAGVDVELLRTADQVDAALAGLTALRALAGEFVAVGDPEEGVIAIPVRELPEQAWPLRAA